MTTKGAERLARYRAKRKAAGLEDVTQRNAKKFRKVYKEAQKSIDLLNPRSFVGCDGEGAGVDDLGRQLYQLFRMGPRELYTGERLSTYELLDFICDDPAGSILVGFAFGYDVTMILRDVPPAQQAKLFAPKEFGPGKSRFVWYKDFDIEYMPKQYFRVRRVSQTVDEQGERKRIPIKGSARTIYETFGFFQKSFLKTIESFDVGTKEQREMIAANKARRSDFVSIDQEERDYCALECVFLAELMEKLREYCFATNIRPKTWNGAGKLASALHGQHNTITAKQLAELVPQGVIDYANMSYYGGRFEITRTGLIGSKVYEHDIRSAYPDAMRKLPCLLHGTWHYRSSVREMETELYIAACKFNHPDKGPGQLCGLPVRSKQGYLYWPLQGAGIYWSMEIEAAKLLGAQVVIQSGWVYESNCSCEPFDWVEQLYNYRRSIGSSGPGYPIKLGINALYGILAQRVGAGKYANMIYAGMITAFTRAKIMEAVALDPMNIVMIATDGVYSLNPLPLDLGDNLGQWEYEELNDMFIVQPGLYWSPDKRKRKSRGLSGKFFETPGLTESFEQQWLDWTRTGGEFPTTSVPVTNFIGLKLAIARGKPETAGVWRNEQRSISFDYTNKRDGHVLNGSHICTNPKPGFAGLQSLPHRDFLKAVGQEPWENARMMFEEMPDYMDLSPPFKD